jgi:hypothetical protein
LQNENDEKPFVSLQKKLQQQLSPFRRLYRFQANGKEFDHIEVMNVKKQYVLLMVLTQQRNGGG